MKFHTLAYSLLLLPVLVAPAVAAQYAQPPAAAPAGPPGGKEAPDTPLAKDMHKIGAAVKKLRLQIKDPSQNDSSLGLVAEIRAAAVAASTETPAYAADQPAEKRVEFVADFQSDMKEFIGKVDALADALKTNDNAAAVDGLKALFAAEKEGHKEFRKPRPQ